MTRGQEPETGYFEVRPVLGTEVLGVYWVPRHGAPGELVNGMTFGNEDRLELLGQAIARYFGERRAADPVPPPRPPLRGIGGTL